MAERIDDSSSFNVNTATSNTWIQDMYSGIENLPSSFLGDYTSKHTHEVFVTSFHAELYV